MASVPSQMTTSIQSLPPPTGQVSNDDIAMLKDVLKEVEQEISAPQAPKVPVNTQLNPNANNAPIIYAMPTAPSCPMPNKLAQINIGSFALDKNLLQYAIVASFVAFILYNPDIFSHVYKFVPTLSKFATYEWVLRIILMILLLYVIYMYLPK